MNMLQPLWAKFLTNQEIDAQITMRRTLISQMVGTLYPAVVGGEILEFRAELTRRLYKQMEE